jgi:hypothetical protein
MLEVPAVILVPSTYLCLKNTIKTKTLKTQSLLSNHQQCTLYGTGVHPRA